MVMIAKGTVNMIAFINYHCGLFYNQTHIGLL